MHDRVRIQIFSLHQPEKAESDWVVDLPHRGYERALTVFSPHLNLLFLGDMILSMRDANTRPLSVPIHLLHEDPSEESERQGAWNCSFSSCSNYFALSFNPMDVENLSVKLHIFHIDLIEKSMKELTFPNVNVAMYKRLGTSFYPYSEEFSLLLLSCQKSISEQESETLCQLLNLRTGEVEQLGVRKHPEGCKFKD